MKYRLINFGHDPKIVGVKTGLGQVELDEVLTSLEIIKNIISVKSYDFEDNRLDKVEGNIFFRILPKAILTDYISYSPYLKFCSFIASDSLANVLHKFNSNSFFSKEVFILNQKTDVQLDNKYYLFQIFPTSKADIDFERSIFFNTDKGEKMTFKSLEDLRRFDNDNFWGIRVCELYFKKDYLNYEPIVHIPFLHCYLVSDELSDELLKHEFSNMDVVLG